MRFAWLIKKKTHTSTRTHTLLTCAGSVLGSNCSNQVVVDHLTERPKNTNHYQYHYWENIIEVKSQTLEQLKSISTGHPADKLAARLWFTCQDTNLCQVNPFSPGPAWCNPSLFTEAAEITSVWDKIQFHHTDSLKNPALIKDVLRFDCHQSKHQTGCWTGKSPTDYRAL